MQALTSIRLHRYKVCPDDAHPLFTYKGEGIGETSYNLSLECAIMTEQISYSMGGYIDILTVQNMYGSDMVYDLETMQYIERNELSEYIDNKVLMIIVDRKAYERMLNYYDGPNKIRPILSNPNPDIFMLSIDESTNLSTADCEIDVSDNWKCNCYEKLTAHMPSFAKLGGLSKTIKFPNKSYYFHPIYVENQNPHTTVSFHRRYPDLTIEANNFVICHKDGPKLMFS